MHAPLARLQCHISCVRWQHAVNCCVACLSFSQSHSTLQMVQGNLKPQHLGLPANLCLSTRQVEAGDSEADEEAIYEAQALRLELTDKVSSSRCMRQQTAWLTV